MRSKLLDAVPPALGIRTTAGAAVVWAPLQPVVLRPANGGRPSCGQGPRTKTIPLHATATNGIRSTATDAGRECQGLNPPTTSRVLRPGLPGSPGEPNSARHPGGRGVSDILEVLGRPPKDTNGVDLRPACIVLHQPCRNAVPRPPP